MESIHYHQKAILKLMRSEPDAALTWTEWLDRLAASDRKINSNDFNIAFQSLVNEGYIKLCLGYTFAYNKEKEATPNPFVLTASHALGTTLKAPNGMEITMLSEDSSKACGLAIRFPGKPNTPFLTITSTQAGGLLVTNESEDPDGTQKTTGVFLSTARPRKVFFGDNLPPHVEQDFRKI